MAGCQIYTLWLYSSPVPYLVRLVKLSKQFSNLWLNEFRYISKFVCIKRDCDCIKVGSREGKKPANVVNSVRTQIFLTAKD